MQQAQIERQVLDWIADHKSEAVNLLRQLIRQPSIPGFEYGAQQVVLRQLKTLGLEVSSEQIDTAILRVLDGYSDTERDYAYRPNVVGRWRIYR